MKKLLYSFLILTLILTVAAPTTFAANNGKGQEKKAEKLEKTYQVRTEEQYEGEDADGDQDRDQDRDGDEDKIFSGLPYGLAKKEFLPYGLAKREDLPSGLAKRIEDVIDEDDLSDLEALALIAEANALVDEGQATYDIFEESEFETELATLDAAMDAVDSEITSLEAAIDALEEGDTLDTSALVAAYDDLQVAIDAFDSLYVSEATLDGLEDQMLAIEEMLSGQVFGEVQGAYPTTAADPIITYIATVRSAIENPVTFTAFVTYSTNLDTLANNFLEMKYASASEVEAYNTDLTALKAELDAWFESGFVADTEVSVYTLPVAQYKSLVDTTLLEDEDALVAASVLTTRINDIETVREALFPVETTE